MNGRLRVAVTLLVLGASVACGRQTDGHAATPVTAFPDLAHYPEVDWNSYRAEDTRRYFSGSAFMTPGGQRCSKNARDYAHRLWCHGPRPDTDGYWDLSFGPDDEATATPTNPPAGADGVRRHCRCCRRATGSTSPTGWSARSAMAPFSHAAQANTVSC